MVEKFEEGKKYKVIDGRKDHIGREFVFEKGYSKYHPIERQRINGEGIYYFGDDFTIPRFCREIKALLN